MFALRAIQAEFGDCLIVQFGTSSESRFILVDGGPPGTFAKHLQPELQAIATAGGRLELAVLSHVDNDHVVGLVDLFEELREQLANNRSETIEVGGLWHNSFAQSIDSAADLEPRIRALVSSASDPEALGRTGIAVEGIAEGDKLRMDALALHLSINAGFANGLVCVDDAPAQVRMNNLTLRVVGPTRANLTALEHEWRAWLDAHEDSIEHDPLVAAMADRSVPNLSSIMLLLEADGKRMLLTGDGRGDHLLEGLAAANLLDADGSIHVDVLKVAHHGSDRDATRQFFDAVKADTYVISANGKYGNPDLATLIWIVEAAKEQGRNIELELTNQTPSSEKLLQEYPPDQYGYSLWTMPRDQNSLVIDLSHA